MHAHTKQNNNNHIEMYRRRHQLEFRNNNFIQNKNNRFVVHGGKSYTLCTCTRTKSHNCTFILLSFILFSFTYSFIHSFVHLIISFESFVFVFFPAFCFFLDFRHLPNAHLTFFIFLGSFDLFFINFLTAQNEFKKTKTKQSKFY